VTSSFDPPRAEWTVLQGFTFAKTYRFPFALGSLEFTCPMYDKSNSVIFNFGVTVIEESPNALVRFWATPEQTLALGSGGSAYIKTRSTAEEEVSWVKASVKLETPGVLP
jgi:hypothetical protein